uniref:Uncharacterized protein n=1 Tax=Anguilla anguilla TaxID=7936 RepID=A0A0E9R328_ANGAN
MYITWSACSCST